MARAVTRTSTSDGGTRDSGLGTRDSGLGTASLRTLVGARLRAMDAALLQLPHSCSAAQVARKRPPTNAGLGTSLRTFASAFRRGLSPWLFRVPSPESPVPAPLSPQSRAPAPGEFPAQGLDSPQPFRIHCAVFRLYGGNVSVVTDWCRGRRCRRGPPGCPGDRRRELQGRATGPNCLGDVSLRERMALKYCIQATPFRVMIEPYLTATACFAHGRFGVCTCLTGLRQ